MTVIVFPGQGSQFVGMSRDFYDNFNSAKKVFNLIQDITEINIKEIRKTHTYFTNRTNRVFRGLKRDD